LITWLLLEVAAVATVSILSVAVVVPVVKLRQVR
jgi:hypothetical protein